MGLRPIIKFASMLTAAPSEKMMLPGTGWAIQRSVSSSSGNSSLKGFLYIRVAALTRRTRKGSRTLLTGAWAVRLSTASRFAGQVVEADTNPAVWSEHWELRSQWRNRPLTPVVVPAGHDHQQATMPFVPKAHPFRPLTDTAV